MEVLPMREFRPSVRHAMIASMLLQGKPVREIARTLKQNPGTVIRMVKRMENHGYIVRQFRSTFVQYSLTILGYSLLEMLKNQKDLWIIYIIVWHTNLNPRDFQCPSAESACKVLKFYYQV